MHLVSILLLAVAIVGSKTNPVWKIASSNQIHHHEKQFKRNDEKTAIPKIDLSNMDPSTSPKEDFYHFVNGGWLKRNSIPSDRTIWTSSKEVEKRTEIVLQGIVEKAASISGDLLGDIFNSGMDENAIEESGLQGISDLFIGVESIKNQQDALSFLGTLNSEGFNDSPFFSLKPIPDPRDSTQVRAYLLPNGLGLPSPNYYFDIDNAFVNYKYQIHIKNMFFLANETTPDKRAEDVYQIESFLAKARIENKKKYGKRDDIITYTYLQKLSSINWDGYFTNLGLTPNSIGDIKIDEPQFFESLPEVFSNFKITQIKNYFKWFILKSTYRCLPKAFQKEGFYFFNHILRGQQQPSPRKEDVIDLISSSLGDELSKRFVGEVFPPQAKKEALCMVEFLQDALKERIEKLDWMEESTREKALEKLKKLRLKVGYPDEWEDYSDLKLNGSSLFLHNLRQILRRTRKKKLEGINKKKVKKWEWSMQSYKVNAYYSKSQNEIVFPAAIFQPPFFFSSNGDFNPEVMAFNFGGIGAIIGHELTHAYDNTGRKYDSKGNFVDWWSEKDCRNFEKRAETIISQFNNLTFHGNRINGYQTLGENIADLGGVKISYLAFQKWMEQYGKPKDLHGFSPNQQFFIAYAQGFRELILKEEAQLRVAIDPHSPGVYRVNQPLSNMQEFYDAFGEPNSTQGMYRKKKERVQIW